MAEFQGLLLGLTDGTCGSAKAENAEVRAVSREDVEAVVA